MLIYRLETPSQAVVILPFTLPTYLLGLSSKIHTKPNQNFHLIDIKFIEDYKQLKYVYITQGMLHEERKKI